MCAVWNLFFSVGIEKSHSVVSGFSFICSKPFQEVILDYDYTFTTPYCGSEMVETNNEQVTIYSNLPHADFCDKMSSCAHHHHHHHHHLMSLCLL